MKFLYVLLILISFPHGAVAESVKERLENARMQEKKMPQQENQQPVQKPEMIKSENERLMKELKEKDSDSEMDFRDEQAKKNLFVLVEDCESYAQKHEGRYPTSKASAGGLPANICGIEHMGFTYECSMNEDECAFKAIPIEPGESGSKTFTIKTGDVKLE